MKMLASAALGISTMAAATFGFAQPAAADASVGVRLGGLCVGLCIDDDHGYRHRRYDRRHHYRDYDYGDYDYSDPYRRSNYYPRYDRRYSQPYYGYHDGDYGYRHHRRHHNRHHRRHRHHDDY